MKEKKPPQEPTGIITDKCDIMVLSIRRTILKISPHCWERNKEFCQSKKKKVRENLNQYLLSKKEIKDFVQQLDNEMPEEEGRHPNWTPWKYYAYDGVIDKRNELSYRVVFFLDDENPNFIGVVTVYPYE